MGSWTMDRNFEPLCLGVRRKNSSRKGRGGRKERWARLGLLGGLGALGERTLPGSVRGPARQRAR